MVTGVVSMCAGPAWSQPRPWTQAQAQAAAEAGSVAAPPAGASEAARRRWLAARIQALIDEREVLAGARIGIQVRDLARDRVVYTRAADQGYNVASNSKIITMAAALALLGPDFRYRTALLAEGVNGRGVVTGDLYLQSQGDPTLSAAGLARLADELVAAGITRVRGELVVDDGYFDGQTSPPHFDEQPEEQAAFRAPVGAVSLERSSFSVMVRPALDGSGPAAVWIEPPSPYLHLAAAQVVTQKSGRSRVLVDSKRVGDRMEVSVSGQVRAGAEAMRFRRRVDDPRAYAGETLRALLAERGLRVRRPARAGRAPADAQLLAYVESEPMNVLVRALGKHSDNFVAEVLLKTLGAEGARSFGGGGIGGGAGGAGGSDMAMASLGAEPLAAPGPRAPATWAAGLEAVRAFLVSRVGLAAGGFRYGNGSGLFDATSLSPAQIVAVLAAAHRDMRYGPDLMAALAIAGADGTLRRRMAGTAAEGRVRAKTGTLARVSALSGYAAVDARRPLAFSILVNDLPATWAARRAAVSLQDEIAAALVAFLGSPRAAAR